MARRIIRKPSYTEGENTKAQGRASHAEGASTQANGPYSHAQGIQTIANRDASHAEGILTKAEGAASHAEGLSSCSIGETAHAEGQSTKAMGIGSHTEGQFTKAEGVAAHAEGSETNADTEASHAEGMKTVGSGMASHAEGIKTIANGEASHAEGYETFAQGFASHTEGVETRANGDMSHVEGYKTIADSICSHAEGKYTIADGRYSHAEGIGTNTKGFEGVHIMGRFGDADSPYSWYVANGIDDHNKGISAKLIGKTGDFFIDGVCAASGTNYAEMFETIDGVSIDVGYFVTVEGKKIRKANEKDQYILGVTTVNPAVLGECMELRWKDKYILDEWERIKYQDLNEMDMMPSHMESVPIINPNWDINREYISRRKRDEWIPVALLGQVLVRDDGTSFVNGYCKSNKDGIATKSNDGYRVLERTSKNQIRILFR